MKDDETSNGRQRRLTRVLGWGGRTMVYGGVLLGLFGALSAAYTGLQSQRGTDALATIEAARRDGPTVVAAGVLDLSWLDHSGARRIEYGVKITPQLAYKLRIGRQLSREYVRVRYRPDDPSAGSVVVVEDVPEIIQGSVILSIVGFLSVTLGSLLVLAGLWWQDRGFRGGERAGE